MCLAFRWAGNERRDQLFILLKGVFDVINLGLKGLADYMTSNAAAQLKTLRDYKYPSGVESAARTRYYSNARSTIREYHRSGRPPAWLLEQARRIRSRGHGQSSGIQTKCNSNARAIESYHHHFRNKSFELLDDLKLELSVGQVRIRMAPDLHVREKRRTRVVRLEFSANRPSRDRNKLFKIMGQAMFEAADYAGLGLNSSAVLCFDVPEGDVHKGARVRSRMRAEIEAACQTIEAVWPTL